MQNGSFKIAAAKDYNDKKNAGNNISLLATVGFMRTKDKDSIFDLYAPKKQEVKWRVNNPKSNRARMSISRPASNPDSWFMVDDVIAEFKSCIDFLYFMLDSYNQEKANRGWK